MSHDRPIPGGGGADALRPSSDDLVLSVRNVSKKFCRNLKRSMIYGVRDLARSFLGASPRPAASAASDSSGLRRDEFWALDNVSLELRRGECLGLVGHNGCGKSTLLRILTGIYPPDLGEVVVRGRLSALIALGAGFHPHMSGRENVYLNGSILGISQREIRQRFDEIVEFSELGPFIDAPVSTYSSGMTVRLGFAVASSLTPDVLLVDEVLAVGDLAFRAKCSTRISRLVEQGTSIILVSHDMVAIQSLCSRTLWLGGGRVVEQGASADVVAHYMAAQDSHRLQTAMREIGSEASSTGDIDIVRVVTKDGNGNPTDVIRPFEPLLVEMHYRARRRIDRPFFWLGIGSVHSPLMNASMLADGLRPAWVEGDGVLTCRFDRIPFLPQVYYLRGGVVAADGRTFLALGRPLGAFRVDCDLRELGLMGPTATGLSRGAGEILTDYTWVFPDGTTHRVETTRNAVAAREASREIAR